jgi:hypothetical protein
MDCRRALADPGTEADWGCQVSEKPEALRVADDCLCGADPGVYPHTYLGDCLTRAGGTIRHQYAQNQEMLKALQRMTHPAADDDDLAYALEVIAKATGGAA